jgi:hypothetical protein
MAARRSKVCFRLSPQSIRMRVWGVPTNVELPAELEARTQIFRASTFS